MAVLWNPLITKSVAIAVPDEDPSTFGFGVCCATNDPKTVKVNNAETKSVMVYTLSYGVWRRAHGSLPNSFIDNFVEFKWPHSQVTINGLIYWFAAIKCVGGDAYKSLVLFDLSTEEFREIYLPSKLALHDSMELFLCNIKDSVAVLKGSSMNKKYEVWVMSNGLSKQFKKHFTVRMPYELPYSSSLPFGFRKNGELMMALTTTMKIQMHL
ncbi:F-box protein At3g61340-like [Bidens hawaiensis]|uniref:F-box protein At3g61340-like n=1 Tax=Bidens hawaiensis TaxID=980011 RepID=UPI004049764C